MTKKTKKGFTIIELALSSAFLGILLITVALLVMHIISIYQKGMTLKAVNTVGEDLVDNFTRSIAASSAVDLKSLCGGDSKCISDQGNKYLYQQNKIWVQIVGGDKIYVPSNGAFCTGKYSYIWNTGYILDDDGETYIKVNTEPGKPDSKFNNSDRAVLIRGNDGDSKQNTWPEKGSLRLARVEDANREVCRSGIKDDNDPNITYDNPGRKYQVSNPDAQVTELLEKSEDNLALYNLTIFPSAFHKNTHHAFYSGTFILATIRGGVNINIAGDFCTADKTVDLNTDFAYCAINKFNFATRATGKTGGTQ